MHPTDYPAGASPSHDLPLAESPDYLTRQLITYIGNKRSLLPPIASAVERVKQRLAIQRLKCIDLFAGSGIVSRMLKAHSRQLISNDLEDYAAVIARCYLANRDQIDLAELAHRVDDLNARVTDASYDRGFIEELYAPRCERQITAADRVFYTPGNARRLDNYRRMIEELPIEWRDFLLGPLLSEASIHANTAGVFKGFYKNRRTNLGQFGGSGGDALTRIRGEIKLALPVLSRFACDHQVYRRDANELAKQVRGLDLAYLDPPYNQHPYGSNYFMLNLLVHYRRPNEVSRVSGIPADWQRSRYNVRSESLRLMEDLVSQIDAPYLLISFNDEGFIPPGEMRSLLNRYGSVEVMETRYNAFRGSRSFAKRSIHVTEQLFLVEKH